MDVNKFYLLVYKIYFKSEDNGSKTFYEKYRSTKIFFSSGGLGI
jgi:hypothetical protein